METLVIYNILEELAIKQINKQFRPARRIAGRFSENLEPLNSEPMNDYIFCVL